MASVTLEATDPRGLHQRGAVDTSEDRLEVEVDLRDRGEGQPAAVVAMKVSVVSPREDLTAEIWRSVPVGAITDAARATLLATRRADAGPENPDYQFFLKAWERRKGRAGHDDWAYAYLALQYVGVWEAGSRSPAGWLADEFGWTSSLVKKRLEIARKRGLLESRRDEGDQGVRLTERAKEVLEKGRA